jgi:hypothetical protein
LGLAIVLLITLSACDQNRVFEEYKSVKGGSWKYDDSIQFKINIEDTAQRYNLFVDVRHNFYFDWRNLWVKVITEYPNHKTELSSVNLPLSASDGVWYGKCSGDICEMRVGIQENAIFPQKGIYTFTIIQDMRQNPLDKIIDIGMRVEKYEKEKK